MAQPSTSSSPSRPQSLALDSTLVQTHAPKGPCSLDQEQHQTGHQNNNNLLPAHPPRHQDKPSSLLSLAPAAPSQHPQHSPRATQRGSSDTDKVQKKDQTHSIGIGVGQISAGRDGEGATSTAITAAATTASAAAIVGNKSTNGGPTACVHPNDQPATATTTTTSSAGPTVDCRIENGQSGTRYNGDRPLSSSSPMSNPQPPPGPPRQPVSYPNPTSYPPTGMPSVAQYAYPPQAVPPPDPYRPAPTQLPSMRTLDHVQSHQQLSQQQQQQQHHQHQHQHQHQHAHQHAHQHQHTISLASHMGSHITPGPAMGYYNVATHPYALHSDPTGGMRFAIAPGLPPDPRIALSGGRHKKEIKRRTKTGCLTCRKRRIKCDETHPTCNNCKKSKRECLGYDPIFKQQQGPAAIQPAPNNSSQSSAAAQTLASTPTVPSSASPNPPYQPPIVPSSYPASLSSNVGFDSPVASTPQSARTDAGFEYSTAIDPALQGDDPSSATGTPSPQYPSVKSEPPERSASGQGQELRAKKMKVDELIALGGPAPPAPSSAPSAAIVDEITKLYYEIYAPGLTSFFESRWYELQKGQSRSPESSNSLALLSSNKSILGLFTSFLQNIIDIKSTDPADMGQSGHLETHIVWALARLPLSSPSDNVPRRSPDATPAEDDLLEVRGRLQVFEALVSGDVLEANPLWSPAPAPDNASGGSAHAGRIEFGFWYHLGQFLLKSHSSVSVDDCSARERCLGQMRALLDGQENRDVLYSIAILREYTLHWDATGDDQTMSEQLDESDHRNKLAVATRFVRNETTQGTTNVARQFANLAYRAFVRPGVNSKSGGKKA